MTNFFEDADRWHGGFYELSFNLPNDQVGTVKKFLMEVWQSPDVVGPFTENNIAPDKQDSIDLADITIDGHMYGLYHFGLEGKCECGTYTANFQEEGQWVSLYFPMSALSRIFEVGAYPFIGEADPTPEPWVKQLSEQLRKFAERLFQITSFDLAILGFESDYGVLRDQILSGNIPDERWEGFLIPYDNNLIWYPPNIWK